MSPADVSNAHIADTATGLPIPPARGAATVEEERRDRRRRLAAALRLFDKHGFGEGVSGHVSVRDPGKENQFWVNPFGVPFGRVTVGDLICVDEAGRVVAGRHGVNPSAFAIHSQIHQRCPGAEAVAHAHTVHSRALGALGRLLEPLDQESASFFEDQAIFADYDGPSITVDQGRAVAERLGARRAILLRFHGLITVGQTLEEAVHRFVTYEGCARVQLLAASAGTPSPMSDGQARAAKQGFGDADLARFSFRMAYDELVLDQPDLLHE